MPEPLPSPAETPLRVGVLGCAAIARAFVRDVQPSTRVRVDAVASRDAARAAAFAADFGLDRHHGSYAALLADPAIDLVYIPLPNSLHAPWAIAAAQAGKHVLCEKPLATGRAEATAMVAAARTAGVMLLEGYPWWFQPQTAALLEQVRGGAIGEVRFIQASFGFTLPDPDRNIRMRPELGGGALLDAGSYPLSLVRLLMGCAPQRVRAEASWAASGVDLSLQADLDFGDGRRAQIACAMDQGVHRQATIVGRGGAITTEFLNHTHDGPQPHPHGFLPSLMRVRSGRPPVPFETVHSPTGSGFRFCAEAFAEVIRRGDQGAIDRAAAASIDIAATLEALLDSARSGAWVPVDADPS